MAVDRQRAIRILRKNAAELAAYGADVSDAQLRTLLADTIQALVAVIANSDGDKTGAT